MSGLVPPLSSRTSGGVCPYPLLLPFAERCQRCDLLVEVEGLHLIAVTRREYAWSWIPGPAARWWAWPGLVLWTGCFEGCWLLLVVLRPLACVLVG